MYRCVYIYIYMYISLSIYKKIYIYIYIIGTSKVSNRHARGEELRVAVALVEAEQHGLAGVLVVVLLLYIYI